ncbi:MAG TPA: hypothetical protein VIQ62_03840 [Burkholderiales bacterium]
MKTTDKTDSPMAARILKLLRVEPTSDIHEAYRFLEEVELDARPVRVAKWPSTRYHIYWPNWLKKPATLLFNHASLLVQLLKGIASGQVVIVREFTNWLFIFIAPIVFPLRRRVILNINDNLAPRLSGLSKACFGVLRRMGFPILLLDGDEVRRDLCERVGDMTLLTPYFAVPDRRSERRTRSDPAKAFIVGFVGYFRHDKGGLEALGAAVRGLKAEPGITIALGYWNRGQVDALPPEVRASVVLRDTFLYSDYLDYLRSCHVIIVLAAREFYELRHSGVLVDSISCGTLTLCPSYPLLRYQVLHPVPVGATYATLEELPQRVRALRQDADRLEQNFDTYFRARSPRAVSEQLERAWRERDANAMIERRASR